MLRKNFSPSSGTLQNIQETNAARLGKIRPGDLRDELRSGLGEPGQSPLYDLPLRPGVRFPDVGHPVHQHQGDAHLEEQQQQG